MASGRGACARERTPDPYLTLTFGERRPKVALLPSLVSLPDLREPVWGDLVPMKRVTTIVAAASAAAVVGLGAGVAVPALADSGSSSASTTSGLSSSQLSSIESFLADHPQLAQQLATRAAGWQKFLAANPGLGAEIQKVMALPQSQRKAELKTYFQAHPDQRKALLQYRESLQLGQLSQREAKIKQRFAKREQQAPSSSLSGSSSTSPSSTSPSSTTVSPSST